MIRSKVKVLSSGQDFLHCKSMGNFFVTQGRVTPKRIVTRNWTCLRFYGCLRYLQLWWRSDKKRSRYPPDNIFPTGNQSFNPNCPKTLCSLSPTPVMLHIKLDQDWPICLRDIQVWNWTRSNTRIFGSKGQVTPNSIVQSGLNSNSSEIFYACPDNVQVSLRSDKTKKAMLRTRSNMLFFGSQGQVTPKWTFRSGQNSNSSKILCLSWKPANLKIIWSKMKALSSGQRFLHYKSMGKFFIASNSKVNGFALIWWAWNCSLVLHISLLYILQLIITGCNPRPLVQNSGIALMW